MLLIGGIAFLLTLQLFLIAMAVLNAVLSIAYFFADKKTFLASYHLWYCVFYSISSLAAGFVLNLVSR